MIEISPIPGKRAEDLDLFRHAIEKAGKLSLPNRTVTPRGVAVAQVRLHRADCLDAGQPHQVLIGNWFWNIG